MGDVFYWDLDAYAVILWLLLKPLLWSAASDTALEGDIGVPLCSCQRSMEVRISHSASVVILDKFQLPSSLHWHLGWLSHHHWVVVKVLTVHAASSDTTKVGERRRRSASSLLGGDGGPGFPHGLCQHCKGSMFVTTQQGKTWLPAQPPLTAPWWDGGLVTAIQRWKSRQQCFL